MTEEFETPEETDFHGNKRELLKLGRSKGKLTWKQIMKTFRPEFMRSGELDVFVFTCENLGIKITGDPGYST